MNRSPEVQANTYFLSNVGPQTPELNRGMWRWGVFLGQTQRLPSERVAIPREFYKILVRRDKAGNLDARAFLLINGKRLPLPPGTQGIAGRRISAREADRFLRDHLHSVGSIARLTGLEYFPALPAAQRLELEQQMPTTLWAKN
jgi:DNA/RNA endonuclease G (NUC1)